ncbi:MAG TPA: hypothetical protein HA360_03190 [Nanoarchaeota archaeon]|nr:hypothetical protein [Nanoarchaeota archaeon]HII14057.1 hypothetical protein [Nanoarchaeota archaeon]
MRSSVYELIGAIYGDGHIHSTENRVTLVGSLEDYYYYTFYLKPLIEKLFPGINVYIRKRNDRNSYYLSFESKDAFQKLQSFHLWRGAKNNLVLPILSNSLSLKLFLRGLFDTDGSLKFSKQSKNINYYPRIQYAFKESDFSRDLGTFLSQAGFTFCRWYDKRDKEYYYQISGDSFLHTWIKTVGLSNPVHYSKYLYWKRFGYFIPRSSLAFRMNALHLKTEDLF